MDNTEILGLLQKSTLFGNFSQKQLEEVVPLVRQIKFNQAGEYIIREDQASTEFFIIQDGEAEVVKKTTDSAHFVRLTTLEQGETIGETALLDNATHSVSVRTLKPTTLIAISAEELKQLSRKQETYSTIIIKLTELIREIQQSANEQSLHSKLVSNIASAISGRLRRTNQLTARSLKQELDYIKVRIAMGNFIINVLMVISIYIFAFKTIALLSHSSVSTTIISIPLIIMFAGAVLLIMRGSGYPLSFYGLTFEAWPPVIKEALLFTIPWLIVITFIKWMIVNLFPSLNHLPVFDIGANFNSHVNHNLSYVIPILLIGGYLILTPIQELIARGALQSSLQEFLTGPNKTWWAIFVSNLIFSMAHVHVSLSLAAAVFIPGLFWGWLYSRHKTLIGVSLSHLIIGGWSFFILGFHKILVV